VHASTQPDRAPPATQAVDPALLEALERARLQVERDWNLILPDAPSREEAIGQLGRLCGGVAEVAAGRQPEELPRGVLARRLVELIRRHLVQELQAAPTADALAFLAAVERVHQSVEPDWAGHFADRLSGPDGMELVVEVAHDLRSPLTSILFLAETLQRARSGPINQIQERQLGLIYSAAFGLSSMASDVIELARGGDRLVDLDPTPFSILDILESVRDIVQPIAEEKGLEVRLTWPPIDFRVGHPVALSRVLLNLTTNALKFTPRRGQIQIRLERTNSSVEISVSDSGGGIAPEFLPYVFDRFRQADAGIGRAHGGLGLGLAITRHLVELHGGRIFANSDGLGKGATFRVELPIRIVHAGAREPREHPHTPLAAAEIVVPELQGVRILAVDDDRDALALVREILEVTGATVTTADSGSDALEKLERAQPDVLLADLGMPQMTGFQLIDRIRHAEDAKIRATPAAALTAFARSEDRAKALRSGFQIHLAKPVDPGELMAAIAALANRTHPGD